MRLLFALFVVITHAYLLTGTDDAFEPLFRLTGHQMFLADLGLAGFFSISGFLILQSLRRSDTLIQYFQNRILRIYPGFVVALVVTVLVGWMVSGCSVTQFFSDPSPWNYLFYKVILFGPPPHHMNGVFTNNPLPGSVNGSLWTIPYEFLFYLLLSVFFVMRRNEKQLKKVVVVLFAAALFFTRAFGTVVPARYYLVVLSPIQSVSNPWSFLQFGMYFMSGVLLNVFQKEMYRYNKFLACTALALMVVFIKLKHSELPRLVLLPVLFVSLGTLRTTGIHSLSKKIGDLSYGIYIYSFLIQQTLVFYFHFNPLPLILATLPIAFLCAALSWRFIEKPALNLKHKRRKANTAKPNFALVPRFTNYNSEASYE